MKLKIAPTSVQSSHVGFASPKPKSPIASPSSSTKCTITDRALVCRYFHSSTSSSLKIVTSHSFKKPVSRGHALKRACSANFDEFFDYELAKQIEGLAQKFDISDEDENEEHWKNNTLCTTSKTSFSMHRDSYFPSKIELLEPPEWPEREKVMWASIERKANSVDIPLSLRMIKKKQQRLEGFGVSGDSACCSVNKAFSSVVLIILELQSYALQMREILCCEDLEGVIARVQREMHESFAWLFQQVFSQTPSLMIHVMILLANFSEVSMANNIANQDPSLFAILCETTEEVSVTEKQDQQESQFEIIPGYNGGGGKVHLVAGGDGGGNKYFYGSSLSIQYPDHISWFSSNEDHELSEKEARLWEAVVDEARRMLAEVIDGVLDHETMQQLVSPVTVELEPDNYVRDGVLDIETMQQLVSPVTVDLEPDNNVDYFATDLLYGMRLSQDPNNPLLLCNYAQFLFLVAHEYDRAEECFKGAIQVEPLDAEALSQYANFLWMVRGDLWEAEERYQQAVAAEPENPYYVSKYANFLWNTGGEETCIPLDTSD
ncbi:hypothetical protein F0562_031707 [Nyssa sinensis]|uniref:Uncharacterized protein n=1 Tax=Nyssa sinensis TaxID=561372 RepID=A0A5J5AUR1_9ASTE|nr:hypothetical protein F0562_031707 [Nyssa sinensis]